MYVAVTLLRVGNRTLTVLLIKQAYEAYFGIKVGDHDKSWALPLKSVALVLNHSDFGAKQLCHLPFPWFGVSLKITAINATFFM